MRVARLSLLMFLSLSFILVGCPKLETTAYDTALAAKAFTDSMKASHPECSVAGNTSTLCVDLNKAIAAKDILIDATEVYCAGPNFNGGGACDPPAKGTPALAQAEAKLQAAIDGYKQAETDLKGVVQ